MDDLLFLIKKSYFCIVAVGSQSFKLLLVVNEGTLSVAAGGKVRSQMAGD